MSKNHDLDLMRRWPRRGIPKVKSVPYLVLTRNFLEAVVSDYNLFLKEHEDTPDAWKWFSQSKIRYYRRFVRKWILTRDNTEKLAVNYEQLTADPFGEFKRIITYFRPTAPVREDRLTRLVADASLEDVRPDGVRVVNRFGVKNRRRLEDFQHFDPVYFGRLERAVADELARSGYSLRFTPKRTRRLARRIAS